MDMPGGASKLIQEGKLKVTRLGRGECYWHKPTVEPPPRLVT